MPDDVGQPTAPAAGASITLEEAVDDARQRHKVAFALTVLVVVGVLAMLPIALKSMADALLVQSADLVYDMFTGQEVKPHEVPDGDAAYINVTATQLDETSRQVTLVLAGHRVCDTLCPAVTGTFYSLGSADAQRRGLPPSASVEVPGTSGSYTFTIQLPIEGTPQRYPFDDYTLRLGLIVLATLPNGIQQVVDSPEFVRGITSLTLENRVSRLNMSAPIPIDPAAARSPGDPADFLLVNSIRWTRPLYLRILTVILVVLISASGIFALGMRTLNELVLGMGGIILGIWGVRSVVVQTPLPDVTLIDLILGFVILVMLLALSIRAASHFFHRSGLRVRRPGG